MSLRGKLALAVLIALAGGLAAWPFRVEDQPEESRTAEPASSLLLRGADPLAQPAAAPLSVPGEDHRRAAADEIAGPTVHPSLPARPRDTASPLAVADAFQWRLDGDPPSGESGDWTPPDADGWNFVGDPLIVAQRPAEARRSAAPPDESPPDGAGGSVRSGDGRPERGGVPAAAESLDAALVPVPIPAAEAPLPSAVTHRVIDGDSLPSLAERYLGDRERWRELFERNRHLLSDPDLLPLGAELQIPAM